MSVSAAVSTNISLLTVEEFWTPFRSFEFNLNSLFLILFLTTCLIISTIIKGLFILYCLFYAPEGRPINILIGLEQVCVLVTTVVQSTLIIMAFCLGQPIYDIFGHVGCTVFSLAATGNGTITLAGGFILVVYRFMGTKFLQFTHVVIGKFRLMWILIVIEVIAVFFILNLWQQSLLLSGNAIGLEFCNGRSPEVAKIFHMYETNVRLAEDTAEAGLNYSKDLGILYRNTILIIGVFASLSEVSLYVILFLDLFNHDKSMVKSLGLDTIRSRNRRNAITLGGQAVCFAIEVTFLISFAIVMNLGGVDRALYVISMPVGSAMTSIGNLAASPEVKRYFRLDY